MSQRSAYYLVELRSSIVAYKESELFFYILKDTRKNG